jgi:hypothetical protein
VAFTSISWNEGLRDWLFLLKDLISFGRVGKLQVVTGDCFVK